MHKTQFAANTFEISFSNNTLSLHRNISRTLAYNQWQQDDKNINGNKFSKTLKLKANKQNEQFLKLLKTRVGRKQTRSTNLYKQRHLAKIGSKGGK